jgi:DNA ligase-1
MLASPCTDINKLKYPILLSPKLDGVRALVKDGVVLSRSLKPIPNKHVQRLFGKLEGYDGELIVGAINGEDVFRNTTSGVMTVAGIPDVKFCVFDRWDMQSVSYIGRFQSLEEGFRVFKVFSHHVTYPEQVLQLEEQYLSSGYEGVMLRGPQSPYKYGRSTEREGWLLKLKRFEDSEAIVVGMEEKMHNGNEATTNALGRTERSSHIENLTPLGVMGALIVRDTKTGVEFNIGTGFSDEERVWWWNWAEDQEHYHVSQSTGGEKLLFPKSETLVKYKFFPSGSKDKPRFPAYLGLRSALDV